MHRHYAPTAKPDGASVGREWGDGGAPEGRGEKPRLNQTGWPFSEQRHQRPAVRMARGHALVVHVWDSVCAEINWFFQAFKAYVPYFKGSHLFFALPRAFCISFKY